MIGYLFGMAVVILAAPGGLPLWRRQGIGLPDIAVCALLGLCAMSTVDIVARRLGLPSPGMAMGGLVVLAAAGVVGLYLTRGTKEEASSVTVSPDRRGLSLLLGSVFVAPAIISASTMAAGPWPDHFNHVDTAYYMGHVHQLLRDTSYPPASLSNAGLHVPYHYGIQNVAALLSRLSGVAAHKVVFAILLPLLTAGIVCAVWRIADWVSRRGLPHWFAMLSLLFVTPFPVGDVFEKAMAESDAGFVKAVIKGLEKLVGSEAFGNGFPQMGGLIGIFLTAVMLYCVFCLPGERSKWLAAFAVGILPLFKSVYLIPVGGLFGIWALQEAWRRRSIVPLIAPGAALGLAVLLSPFSYNPSNVLTFKTDALNETWTYVFDIAVFLGVASIVIGLSGQRLRDVVRRPAVLPVVVISVCMILLVSLMTIEFIDHRGEIARSFDVAQTLRPVWLFVPLALLSALSSGARPGHGFRTAATTAMLMLAVLPVVHRLGSIGFAAAAPEAWHDYVDNRPIAEALSVIPVEGSVIATNSLRYPTRRAHRDLRQMQVPAIFGHQAYAVNLVYEPFEGAAHRLAMQRLLLTDIDPERLLAIADAEGWTHLLLFKREPYPSRLPGRKLFENALYVAIDLFPAQSAAGSAQ